MLLLPFQVKMKVTHITFTCVLFLFLDQTSGKPFLSTRPKCEKKEDGHLTIVLLNIFTTVTNARRSSCGFYIYAYLLNQYWKMLDEY